MPDVPQRRLAAIMFTDIVGYSALMGADEDRAFEVLRKNRQIHTELISKFSGNLIKEMGDGMLVSYNLASDAVRCAMEIQKACREQSIPLKIGIHEGEMVFMGADVLGDGVNIASRLQEEAKKGCIYISGAVYKDIKNKTGLSAEFIEEKVFKNVDEPVKVYKVRCEGHEISESTSENWGNRTDHLKSGIIPSSENISNEGKEKTESIEDPKEQEPTLFRIGRKLRVRDVFILTLVVVVVVVILVYPKIFKKDKLDGIRDAEGKISIAVMPFKNLSRDTLYNVWQSGFQNLLIAELSNSEGLSVRQYQVMYSILESKGNVSHASITPSIASELALKLETRIYILGNILKAGNNIRINAQLVNAETEEIYKTFQVDGNTEDNIFKMADSLSYLIKNHLEIEKLFEQYNSPAFRGALNTNSPKAFEYYIHGYNAFMDLDFQTAVDWLSKAVEIDSGFIAPYTVLSFNYLVMGQHNMAKNWCNLVYKKRDDLPLFEKLVLDHLHAYYYENPHEEIKYLKKILEIEEMNTTYWYLLGSSYYKLHQYRDATIIWEKAFDIHKKWGTNLYNPFIYPWMGNSYHHLDEHGKEREIYEVGLRIFPDLPFIIYRQAICALSQGQSSEANILIEKYKLVRKSEWSESKILSSVGYIYVGANLIEEAEIKLREALKIDPQNSIRMSDLAWLLIDNDINVEEGLDLIQKSLEINPDAWYALDTKGWGLYKSGRYKEALNILKSSWHLRPAYRYTGYQHILEVEKALANQSK